MSPFSPPKKAAFVIGISATLFQPVRSGSHLYTANLYTLRSGHRVKGLTDSRGSFPLGLPYPRLLYPYCITTWAVCQEVFWKNSGLFSLSPLLTILWLVSVPSREPNRTLKGLSKRDKVQWLLVINPLLFLLSTVLGAFAAEVPLLTPLLYHIVWVLSRGFWYIFFRVYRNPYYPPKRFVSSSLSPWHHYNTTSRSKMQVVMFHKFGIFSMPFFSQFVNWLFVGAVV